MIDSKQFIIMDAPFEKEDFLHVTLSNGKILSYHKDLHIDLVKDEAGNGKICLLGWAFQCEEKRKDPIEEIQQAQEGDDLEEILDTWSGRWLLIYDGKVYLDACGLLGCFYTKEGILSSSLNCINQALKRKNMQPGIRHGFGLDYYPGMKTMYPDVMRLMPSQIYDLKSNSCRHRNLILGRQKFADDEQRLDAVIQYFQRILKNLARTYSGQIMLPLTGGYDSRTMLALLEYSGISYSVFTMEHDHISQLDMEAPPALAKLVGKEYQYIKRVQKPSRQRLKAYDLHCGGMASDEDRNFYACDQYPHGKGENVAVLRAGVWECAYYTLYNWVEKSGFQISRYKKKYVNVRCRKDISDSLEAYFEFVQIDEQQMKWPVRFYREQRMGCWLSGVEQSLTLIDNMDSLQLCNCGRILEILAQLDLGLLVGKKHEIRIIEKTCPQLLDVTLQNKENKFQKSSFRGNLKKDLEYFSGCRQCLGWKDGIKESLRFIKRKAKRGK